MHAQRAAHQAVHVMQHQPRVALHRARDVEQHHQRRQLLARPGVARGKQVRLAHHALQCGAQIDAGAAACAGRGLVAAAAHRIDRQRQLLGQLLGQRVFGRGHGLEVGPLQPFALGKGELRVELQFVPRGALGRMRQLGRARRRQRIGQPMGARRARHVAAPGDLRQPQRQHLLEQFRVAPEGGEGDVEQRLLLVALEQHRAQGRMHVAAPLQPHPLHRRQRGQHAIRADRHTGVAQHAREVNDVVGDHRPLRAARSRATRPAAWRCRRLASSADRPGA